MVESTSDSVWPLLLVSRSCAESREAVMRFLPSVSSRSLRILRTTGAASRGTADMGCQDECKRHVVDYSLPRMRSAGEANFRKTSRPKVICAKTTPRSHLHSTKG